MLALDFIHFQPDVLVAALVLFHAVQRALLCFTFFNCTKNQPWNTSEESWPKSEFLVPSYFMLFWCRVLSFQMRLCWFGTPPTANSTNPWWLLAVSTSLVWTFGDLPIDTDATDSPRSHPNICDSFWCVSVFTNQRVNGVFRIDMKKFTNLIHQSPTPWEWWLKPTPLTACETVGC